jgi:hypothetical protein
MVGVPANSGTVIVSADAEGDEVFLDSSGFDKPSRVLFGIAGQPLREIKSAPAFFEVDDLAVTQHSPSPPMGHKYRIFWWDIVLRLLADLLCSPATEVLETRTHPDTTACWAGCGWPWWQLRDGEYPRRRRVRDGLARAGRPREQT